MLNLKVSKQTSEVSKLARYDQKNIKHSNKLSKSKKMINQNIYQIDCQIVLLIKA